MMKKIILPILTLAIFFIIGCEEDSSDNSDTNFERLTHFYENANTLQVDVAYEENATPYINEGFGGDNNFLYTKKNLTDLLSGRSNAISVMIDEELNEMTEIPAQGKNSYTQQEILDLASEYQDLQSTENQGVIFLIYLDGYYNINGQANTSVLGLSVGSFTVAVFKPVIDAISGGGVLGGDPKPMVEQATVTHEVGHALGLVNNGVDLHTSHQDDDHGKHCSNTDCVMYWEIASASGAYGLFGSSASVNEMVFGQECKDDITNF